MAGHDGDRNLKIPGGAADGGDKRTWPLGVGAGPEHEDKNILLLVDQLQDLFRRVAFAHHALRRNAGDRAGAGRVFRKLRVGFLARLRAHEVGNPEPLLTLIVRFQHPQHDHVAVDAPNAERVDGGVAITRDGLIKKALCYSPRYGEIDFTVPLFDGFMRRWLPDLAAIT